MATTITYDRIIDLSQEITRTMQVFPAYPKPTFVPWTRREVHGFLSEALFLISHTGTHVDAPWHYRPEGKKLHELPVDRFVGPARLLDVRPAKRRERITAKKLEAAARRRGIELRGGDAVLLRTGWEAKRGTDAYLFENPGLTKDGARWLVGKGVRLVGIDTANVDLPTAVDFPAHHTLLAADIPIIENVANLGAIPHPSFTLVALPLRLRGATGSPIRAIALV
ncbi:MAG: cyclase family protein [Euryarchaeota archaeon]|nr:cyclase family protein [Euryarchaeota archaeon]